MRLFPPELGIAPDEGFAPDKDIFGRKEFGDQLTHIIRALEGPAVLVLDAPWGSGKSTFVKMWRGELTKLGFPSIYFDAFKSDYHEDAFLALAGEIVARSEELKPRSKKALTTFKKSAITVAKVLGRASVRAGTRIVTAGVLSGTEIEAVAHEAVKAIGDETAKGVDEILRERLESHREDRAAFEQFGSALGELVVALSAPTAAGKSTPPLIFIIDELDRCRPPFALELLEKAKHFFSVPGVIFMLVTNLEQLEAAVRLAYGVGVAARAYLEKFYHLRVMFPEGNLRRRNTAADTFLRYVFTKTLTQPSQRGFAQNVTQVISEFERTHSLSLRTLERVASYISLFVVSTAQNQLRPEPLIAGLCLIKVVAPEIYDLARTSKLTFAKADEFF